MGSLTQSLLVWGYYRKLMADIFVISDTHFGHTNILNFTDSGGTKVRSFYDIHHMNEHMVDRWNSVVKKGDKVYHLGDVFFGDKPSFQTLWPRLNGSKRLVVGNHDDVKYLSSGGFFRKVMLWRRFDHLLLTHVPVHPTTLGENRFTGKQMVNVHGHIHQNKSPPGNYKCVCVEQIDYTPVALEELY
jgi:calcineurin-like phosphoesterase family protein